MRGFESEQNPESTASRNVSLICEAEGKRFGNA